MLLSNLELKIFVNLMNLDDLVDLAFQTSQTPYPSVLDFSLMKKYEKSSSTSWIFNL